MKGHELKAELETVADEHGEIESPRPTITVEYETRNGNIRSREGEVWRVSDGGTFDDAVIRFSENAGEKDEDPYFIRVRNGSMKLFSISLASSTETELGDVEDVKVEGLESGEDDEIDPLAAFEKPDDIEEGMELTDGSGDVWLLKEINGGDTTVSVWKDGRRKRKERLPTRDIRNEYQNGELEVV